MTRTPGSYSLHFKTYAVSRFMHKMEFAFQQVNIYRPWQESPSSSFIQPLSNRTRQPNVTVSNVHRTRTFPFANVEGDDNIRNGRVQPRITGVVRRLFLGFDPTPELGAILVPYFVQGALGISRLAVSFFLKDELSMSPAAVSAMMGLALFPWLIKPLYGFLTDALPIFGYRRRPYLVAAAIIGSLSWLSFSSIVNSPAAALAAATGTSLSVAVADVVVDSLVVERVRDLPASRSGALQSLCWGASAVGGLISAYLSGSLLEVLGARKIFALTAVLPLTTAVLGFFIAEPKVDFPLGSFRRVVADRSVNLFNALRNPSVFLPTAFIFCWQATPSPDSALFFFQTNVLHFGPEFLGRVRLASSAASLIGLWLYNVYFRSLPLKTIMLYSTLASVPLSLTQVILVTRLNVSLGISDQLFVLTDSAVLTALGQITFMPTLVLAARLCPPGVEGTLFAALMSLYNASGTTSSELGALLTSLLGITETNFDNLASLVVLCSLTYLLPLPLLNFMDRAPPDVSEEQEVSSRMDTSASIGKSSKESSPIESMQPNTKDI